MKTLYKSIIIVVALALVSTMVFGITAIASDDTAYKHAVWTTEKCRDSITYQGVEYKLLDGDVMPLNCRDYEVEDSLIYITEPDKTSTKDSFCAAMSFDGNFITTDIDNNKITYRELMTATATDGTMEVYCKADIYDDVMAYINKGLAFTDYYYEYCKDSPDSKNEFYFLSDEENDAINQVISTETPVKNSTIDLDKCNIATLKSTDDNHYFVGDEKLVIAQNADSKIYVMIYSEEKCAYTHYEVPETMYDIFANLLNR